MSTPLRPMPADFRELAPGKSNNWLQTYYATGRKAIYRWRVESGIPEGDASRPLLRKPAPADFAEHAAIETNKELCARYNISRKVIDRWRKQTNTPASRRAPPISQARPVPAGFVELASTMPRYELAKHFSCGISTVQRWAREIGARPYTGRRGGSWGKPKVTVIDTRTDSEASRAQSYLQRFYPVWRCNPDGTFNPKGSHFRCDGITRTQDEMIERAVRKGWQRDDWRRLAA